MFNLKPPRHISTLPWGCLRGDVGIATGVPRIAADSELGRVRPNPEARRPSTDKGIYANGAPR